MGFHEWHSHSQRVMMNHHILCVLTQIGAGFILISVILINFSQVTPIDFSNDPFCLQLLFLSVICYLLLIFFVPFSVA